MRPNWITLLLSAIALVGVTMARLLYPPENEFSIFTATISFLGSPDNARNPAGYLWYQVGMTALVLLLARLVWERHRNFQPHVGSAIKIPTSLYLLGMILILFSVWIPDSRKIFRGEIRTGHLHTRIAIISIFMILFAVIADTVALSRSGFRKSSSWPIRIYALLWIVCIGCLVSWEWKCRQNPELEHWPGEGIHSTPLWEWILFTYLIGFLCWVSRAGTVKDGYS